MKKNIFTLLATGLIIAFLTTTSCNKNETVVTETPFASFVVSPAQGDLNTLFTFNAESSSTGNSDNTGLLYRWDFENDGIWDTEWDDNKVIYKRFMKAGFYNIGLEVKTRNGKTAWTSRSVSVENKGGDDEKPVATFTISPPSGEPGTVFTFDASGVSDNNDAATALQVRWDFNADGIWDTQWSTNKIITKSYDTPGTYTVKLEVKDTEGYSNVTTRSLTVGGGGNVNIIELEFVPVQGGTFSMGCTASNEDDCNFDEFPIRQITINSFQISKYETTNAQFAIFLNNVGCSADGIADGKRYFYPTEALCRIKYSGGKFTVQSGYENFPVVAVTWEGAKAFAEYVGGKLPTEAQWEYAARGGNFSHQFVYSGSNDIDDVAWYAGNSYGNYKKVGTKTPNELGIYDMSGNAMEWCNDWYGWDYYNSGDATDPQGPPSGTNDTRCVRGGSVFNGPDDCRVSDRYWHDPETVGKEIGFRVVK